MPGLSATRTRVLTAMLLAVTPAPGLAQTVEWFRQLGTPAHDRAFAIVAHASGVYVAGATEGTLPGQRSAGAIDAFVRRYDASEIEVWTRQFGTPGIDEILAIAVDDSGVYVAGDTQGLLVPSNGPLPAPHAFVRKYDLNGAELWTREFGSGRREEVFAMAAAPTGVYAAGDTTVTAPPFDDAFVASFDRGGTPGWGRGFGTAAVDRASAIVVHASGVYVAGATQGGIGGQTALGDSDGFLSKYDFEGTELWTRQFGTPEADEVTAIAADASGVYLAGTSSGAMGGQTRAGGSDAFVARYDLDGRPVWVRQFGTADYDDALGVAVTAQGVYVVGNTKGALPGQSGAGDYDAFVRKYDLNGAALWTQQFGSGAHDEALGVTVDPSGVYVVGVTDGALPGQLGKGSFDAFIVKVRDGAARPNRR